MVKNVKKCYKIIFFMALREQRKFISSCVTVAKRFKHIIQGENIDYIVGSVKKTMAVIKNTSFF